MAETVAQSQGASVLEALLAEPSDIPGGDTQPAEALLVVGTPFVDVYAPPMAGMTAQVVVWTTGTVLLRLVRGNVNAPTVVGGPYAMDTTATLGWPPPRVQIPPGRRLQAQVVGGAPFIVTIAAWDVGFDRPRS